MERKKFNILNIFLDKIIFGFIISLLVTVVSFTYVHNVSAFDKASISASVSEERLTINGTDIIESSSETFEHSFNIKANTTNKTGYTVSISSSTEETALINTNPKVNSKINSTDYISILSNLQANTWGYSYESMPYYYPIPSILSPSNIIETYTKSKKDENHTIRIGMKLNSKLKLGDYENKILISITANAYTPKAIMTEGPDFNKKLKSLETATNKIKYFRKSSTAPISHMNAINVEDEESDYEISLWLDPNNETAYYYTEPGLIYLNQGSNDMFYGGKYSEKLKNLVDIDMSSFNTQYTENMRNMFSELLSIPSLDLSSFNTENVVDMHGMFFMASGLKSLNMSSFNTKKVRDMAHMFYGATSLLSLDLSNFNTHSVMDMSGMFSMATSLTALNLASFNTENVKNMNNMFYGINSLISLDLSSFNTQNVTSMRNMFAIDSSNKFNDRLITIYVKDDFAIGSLVDTLDIFNNRYKLRGGAGSYLTNPATADKSWLRVDDPTNGRPGYFTRKP